MKALALFLLSGALALPTAHALEVQSPDGKLTVTFAVRDFAGRKACPVYAVTYQGRPIVTDFLLRPSVSHASVASCPLVGVPNRKGGTPA